MGDFNSWDLVPDLEDYPKLDRHNNNQNDGHNDHHDQMSNDSSADMSSELDRGFGEMSINPPREVNSNSPNQTFNEINNPCPEVHYSNHNVNQMTAGDPMNMTGELNHNRLTMYADYEVHYDNQTVARGASELNYNQPANNEMNFGCPCVFCRENHARQMNVLHDESLTHPPCFWHPAQAQPLNRGVVSRPLDPTILAPVDPAAQEDDIANSSFAAMYSSHLGHHQEDDGMPTPVEDDFLSPACNCPNRENQPLQDTEAYQTDNTFNTACSYLSPANSTTSAIAPATPKSAKKPKSVKKVSTRTRRLATRAAEKPRAARGPRPRGNKEPQSNVKAPKTPALHTPGEPVSCDRCGEPSLRGNKNCDACNAFFKSYKDLYHAQGKCINCQKPNGDLSRKLCQGCRDIYKARRTAKKLAALENH